MCLLIIILLLIGNTVQNIVNGGDGDAIPATALTVAMFMVWILDRVSVRTVEGEVWIRRLGMGDLEFRVEPTGNDEIAKALHALEAVRQTCIRAMQMERVQQLSDELQDKNQELEGTLAELSRTQDRIVAQKKLAELGELSAGVAHEMRNPLNIIKNFAQILEPVYNLFRISTVKASTTICRLVLSFLSQFFQSRRHFSSQAKDRSTTHRFGSTTKVCSSLRFTTSTEAPNRPCTAVAKGFPV